MMKIPSPHTPEKRAESNYYKLGGYAFHRMKLYLKDMRDLLRSHRFKLTENHKEELEKYPKYPQLINEVYRQHYQELDVHFVRILLNSTFIASFSVFEIMFKEVCQLAAYKYSQKAELHSTSGVIDRCRSYIVRDLRIDISDLKPYWKDIIRYRELRNHLVHHDSAIKKNPKNIVGFIRKRNHIKIVKVRNRDEFKFSIMDNNFIVEFLDCSSQFLANILLKLPKGAKKEYHL